LSSFLPAVGVCPQAECGGGLDAKLMRDWLDDGKVNADDRDPYGSTAKS
jgi:hypothetical protein